MSPYYNPYNYYPYNASNVLATQQSVGPTQQVVGPTSIIWVKGAGEAASYPVAPNNAVALWDSDAPVIYLKQADAAGKPTVKAFDLVERKEVKEDEDDVMKAIASMKAEIEALKSDVYGIAGKKRKKEEDE